MPRVSKEEVMAHSPGGTDINLENSVMTLDGPTEICTRLLSDVSSITA
jgi:hypothetical protein